MHGPTMARASAHHVCTYMYHGLLRRFFCPSLELISEYLRLSPCVAGATLLSFGNGAPDVFTQLAAISQVKRVGRMAAAACACVCPCAVHATQLHVHAG